MIGKHLKRIILITLVYLVNSYPGPIVHGQPKPQRQAEGVDLILMIDESGSMGGYGAHPIPNDPHNKRNELLHVILPYIVESVYRGSVFRVSVVEFGARYGKSTRWRPTVTLSMYKIKKPVTGESRSDYLQRVSTELDHLRRDRTRGESDHGAALELVLKEIGQYKSKPVTPPIGQIGTTNREVVVFLITDGMPYVSGQDGKPIPPAQLKKEIQDKVKGLPASDTILFSFGINDADDYWDKGYGNFWDLIATATSDNKKNRGHAQKLNNDKELFVQILPLITRYTNPPGLEIIHGDTLDCPPYLKSLQFIVEYPRSHMKVSQCVEITQPDQTLLNTSNAKEMKLNAFIDVPNPIGGVWRFKRLDPDVKLMVKKNFEKLTFLSPASPIHMRSSHHIKFKAPTGTGPNNTFQPLPKCPLQARVIIRTPQNTKDVLNADIPHTAPGEFVSKTPYQFQHPGEYKVEFEATVTSGAGTPLVVMSSDIEKIQVSDSTPLEMKLEEPTGNAHSSIAHVKQEFVFGFYTDNGQKNVPLKDALNTNDKIDAVAEVMDTASKLTIEKADFKLSPKNGNLAGTADLNLSWMELLKILSGKRMLKVTVKIDQRHIDPSYFLVVPQTQTRLYEFSRKLGEGILTYVLIALAILLLVFLAVWLIYLFSRHQCSDEVPELVFRQENSLDAQDGYEKKIVVDKPKIRFKRGDIAFIVPESTELWKPELTIKRNCIDQGVAVTIEYEKFGKTNGIRKNIFHAMLEKLKIRKANPDKELNRKATLQTRFPRTPYKHHMEEFRDTGMVFELRVQGKTSY
jgi:hypothetical protein